MKIVVCQYCGGTVWVVSEFSEAYANQENVVPCTDCGTMTDTKTGEIFDDNWMVM